MSNYIEESSKAKQLAAILNGRGAAMYRGVTIQRSHRFPLQYLVNSIGLNS